MAVVACGGCGAKTRVENRGPGVQAVCGRCGQPLPAPGGKPLELTDAAFAQTLAGAGARPVLVDCWAPWCGPCRALTPVVDRIAEEAAGRWVVAKLNVDENPVTSSRFQIRSIPTLLVLKSGDLVDSVGGVQPKAAIEAMLARHA
ncbi:MAG: thioredoxin [Actinomycetota bacterium]